MSLYGRRHVIEKFESLDGHQSCFKIGIIFKGYWQRLRAISNFANVFLKLSSYGIGNQPGAWQPSLYVSANMSGVSLEFFREWKGIAENRRK